MIKKPKWTLENGGIQVIPAQPGHFAAEAVCDGDAVVDIYLTPVIAWALSDSGYPSDDDATGFVCVAPITVEEGTSDWTVMFFDDGGDGYFYAPHDRRLPNKKSAISYLQGDRDAEKFRRQKKAEAR